MDRIVNIGLAGIGGYGESYVEAILPKQQTLGARLVGAVDPTPQRCRRLHDLEEQKIPLYPSIGAMFDEWSVDLMFIVTPIHLHASQSCMVLEQGVNVLCEKPLAGSLSDALCMMEAQKKSTAFAAIGFQWSFSHAIQSLKRDIMEGVLGRPIRLSTLVLWPRPIQYFQRNDWAGKIRMADGAGVFDSPVNNATAHFLHNMLYILGRTRETSATPLTLQAELYRANAIENYDTAALRCGMEDGVELLFYTSHAVTERRGPRCRYEFENAVVEFDGGASAQFIAHFKDGRTKYYGRPNADRHEKIWQAITAVRGGQSVACGVDAALPHAMCVHAAQQSSSVMDFPSRLRQTMSIDGEAMHVIGELDGQLTDCFERGIMPVEHGEMGWAGAGQVIDVRNVDTVAQADGQANGQANGQPRRPPVSVTIPAATATVRT